MKIKFDTRKETVSYLAVLFIATMIGAGIGQTIAYAFWGSRPRHLCKCEYCKAARQREALEVVDSVIPEKIVVYINKED